MQFKEGAFYATLVTKGRRTGMDHSVKLRTVFYNGKFYFSRRNPNSDWLKNAIASSSVKIIVGDINLTGRPSLVEDDALSKKISSLKYSDNRAEESRIVLEVIPYE